MLVSVFWMMKNHWWVTRKTSDSWFPRTFTNGAKESVGGDGLWDDALGIIVGGTDCELTGSFQV